MCTYTGTIPSKCSSSVNKAADASDAELSDGDTSGAEDAYKTVEAASTPIFTVAASNFALGQDIEKFNNESSSWLTDTHTTYMVHAAATAAARAAAVP